MSSELIELKKVLRGLLVSLNRNGVTIQSIEQIYRDREGRKIPLFGHADIISFFKSISDTLYMETNARGQLLVFPVKTEKIKHITNMVAQQHKSKRRYRGSINVIRSPRYNNQQNCQNTSSPKKNNCNNRSKKTTSSSNDEFFSSKYNKYANSSKANANDEISQFNTDILNITTKTDSKSYDNNRIYENNAIDTIDEHQTNEIEQFENCEEILIDYQLLQFGEENIAFENVEKVNFCRTFEKGSTFRLFLAQIHSPYKFWIQLKDDGDNIDALMASMNRFYHFDENAISNTPIPEDYLVLGRICAALYQSEWHRAEIVEILDYSVKVFYVDYGTVGEVDKKFVRFLTKEFANDAVYAHRACLDRCKPCDGIWTLEAMEAFAQRSMEFMSIPILAKVTTVNVEEETIYVDLIDTGGVLDQSLRDWLIDSNFAYPTKKLLFDFQKRHYNEVYPSFDKLESGKYPSFMEIKQMLSEGFDFLDYENSIIIPEMYGYETIE